MKIRTSLLILSATFILLIAAIGLITFQAFGRINVQVEEGARAGELIKEVFELNIVTYDFLRYHEQRMQQQWALKYDSVGRLLERMRSEEAHPESVPPLESIASDYKALGSLFSRVQAVLIKRKELIEKNGP